MQSPLVSVIIPNFNHAQYLNRRIKSVLSQTYSNFEVILLDDFSNDNSGAIIESYRSDQRFSHIIYNEVNSGNTFLQWSKGISLSKGEYVWIAESDDWCEPSFLENIIFGMLQNKNCVVGYCQSYYVKGENEIIWQSSHTSLSEFIGGTEFISKYMMSNTAIYNASMAVWKKDTFEKISDGFLQFKLCGDWLFWIELCRYGDVFISGKLLNYFRKHDGSASESGIKSGENLVQELEMFSFLFKKKLIGYGDYLKGLKSEYIQFKAIARKLSPERALRIKKMFFNELGTKAALKSFYRKFYAKYVITKMVIKIFA